jgi:hypothetical protein
MKIVVIDKFARTLPAARVDKRQVIADIHARH